MSDGNILDLKTPAQDPLNELLKHGAQQLLAKAVEAELAELLEQYSDLPVEGKQAVVRNGYLPERTVQTGLGDLPVKVPKVRDRSAGGIKFNSSLVPPYLKRTNAMEEFIPWLYLKGISTGEMQPALEALLGEGVYSQVRMDDKLCLLVLIGSHDTGRKEVLAVVNGYRESEASWLEVLEQLVSQGLSIPPEVVIGDGALGLWKAVTKRWPETVQQRCWVHKTANVLNKVPKPVQPKIKEALQDIWMADSRDAAYQAYDACTARFEAKYPRAMECLHKDKERLLAFYDFPAEHWAHLTTTNPIESVFASVRLRTGKTKNCGSRKTTLAMAYKLIVTAQRKWRRLRGYKLLADVIQGVKFKDGECVEPDQQQGHAEAAVHQI